MDAEQITSILRKFTPDKDNLIKALHKLQDNHPMQYVSEEIMNAVAEYFKLTRGQVFGVVTYYSMFSIKPRGKYIIRLCKSPVCWVAGTDNIVSYFEQKWKLKPGQTSEDGLFTLELSECLGICGKAPSMMINKEVFTDLDEQKIDKTLLNKKNNS